MEDTKIRAFTDLKAWQNGHQLVVAIYRLTRSFPREEIFGITNQLRRAAVSITSNLAEGFARKSGKEKSQFYSITLGSLNEVQSQLLVARDVGYLSTEELQKLLENISLTHKLTNGLIRGALTRHS